MPTFSTLVGFFQHSPFNQVAIQANLCEVGISDIAREMRSSSMTSYPLMGG